MRLTFFLFILLVSGLSLANWEEKSFEGSRYFIYTPKKNADLKKAQRSLMINLHGCAQKASTLKEKAAWEAPAEKHSTVIVIPEVPNGGVYTGCWNYYGKDHNEKSGHNGFILGLTKKIINQHQVNPGKVYLSGISSGAGLSLVLSCLAPDLYAGIGLNAGPGLGTSAFQIGRASISSAEIEKNCRKLAKGKATYFTSQIASVIYGENDFIVDPDYNKLNANALAQMYQSSARASFDLSALPGSFKEGSGVHFLVEKRPVVSLIENKNLGHNWPGGQGKSTTEFVNQNSIHYAAYLLDYLSQYNRRP